MGQAHSTTLHVEDVAVGGRRLALMRLVPPPGRPATIAPPLLEELAEALLALTARARDREIDALGLIGTDGSFAAGADLRAIAAIAGPDEAATVARAGHRVIELIADFPVATFAYITGPALGGGLELALACRYRVAAADAAVLSLPETALGLVPGWGGCYHLPHLLGADTALRIIVDDPARQRRLNAQQALDIGLVDTVQRVAGGRFRDSALAWTIEVLAGAIEPERPDHTTHPEAWHEAVSRRRADATRRAGGGARGPQRALDLVDAACAASREEAFAAEDAALVELIMSDELRAGLYAFDVLTRGRRAPASALEEATPVRRVGVLGAGLMASQLATLLARELEVPVVMRDLDAERADAGLAAARSELAAAVTSGRLSSADAEATAERISATVELEELTGADLVIEAIVERLDVKQRAFAEIEPLLSDSAILATNTSALSVTDMGASLRHPERLVGLHFFNPVARMPLVEVIRTAHTSERTHATAMAIANGTGKTPLACADAPGFVVNRLLLRLLSEVLASVDEGTDLQIAATALEPMGLPMGPFQLLQLVGPAVAQHVLETLNAGFGDERFPLSSGLAAIVESGEPLVHAEGRVTADSPVRDEIARFFGSGGSDALDAEGVLRRVQLSLAEETRSLLADGVVQRPQEVDLGMLLGAGWPWHNGGLTPYLDRVGASAAAGGGRFHAPGVASIPV